MHGTCERILAVTVVAACAVYLLSHAVYGGVERVPRPETVREVGSTIVITDEDGNRTYCRYVGPELVCRKEVK